MAERPLASYAGLVAMFAVAVGGFTAANRRRVGALGWTDLAHVTLATHKLSRLVTKDEVTTFIRAPVTQDEDATEPKPTGVARAVGELLTCPNCIGLWAAAGLAAGTVALPRETRFATSILAAHAGSDFLNAAYVRLKG